MKPWSPRAAAGTARCSISSKRASANSREHSFGPRRIEHGGGDSLAAIAPSRARPRARAARPERARRGFEALIARNSQRHVLVAEAYRPGALDAGDARDACGRLLAAGVENLEVRARPSRHLRDGRTRTAADRCDVARAAFHGAVHQAG